MRGASLWFLRTLLLCSPPPSIDAAIDKASDEPTPDSTDASATDASATDASADGSGKGSKDEATKEAPTPAASTFDVADAATAVPRAGRRGERLRRYLALPRVASDVMLPNGALGIGAAGGWPDLYRLTLGIGVLDHLSLGVDTHWLPEQRAPKFAPKVAVAAYRGERFEFGMEYHQRLYTPPSLLAQGEQFAQRDHIAGVFATFGLGLVSASGTLGAMSFRARNPAAGSPATDYVERVAIAGALRLRVGDERWGVVLRGEMPVASLSIGFELRIGLFGQRALIGRRARLVAPSRPDARPDDPAHPSSTSLAADVPTRREASPRRHKDARDR